MRDEMPEHGGSRRSELGGSALVSELTPCCRFSGKTPSRGFSRELSHGGTRVSVRRQQPGELAQVHRHRLFAAAMAARQRRSSPRR